jgi:GNAT superfamily N-acetyltransferase/RimJ/RimL family protein N-acetyltransferase
MDIAVTPLDPADEAASNEALDVNEAARAADLPDFPPVCPVGFAGNLRHPWPGHAEQHFLARAGGRAVGHAVVVLPQLDNLDNADLELRVHPEFRRRGVGTALFRHAEAVIREAGRKNVVATTVESLAGGVEHGTEGIRFAEAMGFASALVEVRRRLDTGALDEAALDAMLRDGWAKADGYSLVRWADDAADEHVADLAYLDGRLIRDAPMGDLAWEPIKMDVARFRAGEAARAARGARTYNVAARHDATGRLVAWTAIGYDATAPWHAWQFITIVEPRHRGHRLGAVVKVENLRYTLAAEPQTTTIDTWNAAVNDHMISINEAMGFRPQDRWHDYQLTL